MPDLHDVKNHPGKRKLYKRIRQLYLTKERSTSHIGEILGMSAANVQKILKQMNIELNPRHLTNPRYFPTKSHLTPHQLLKEIKRLYVDKKLPANHIAKKLGINEGTVRTKLKAMRIKIVHRKVFKEKITVSPNFNIKGIYLGTSEPFTVWCFNETTLTHKGRSIRKNSKAKCQWCRAEFTRYIDKGPRTQLYCCSSCKNKAKDYRRMLKGKKVSESRIKSMECELKETWQNKFQEARDKILSAVQFSFL